MVRGHPALGIVPDEPSDLASPAIPADGAASPADGAAQQGSILDRRITLAELLDLRSFRDVCASFVDLYKIGIKIFDADDTKLVDIRVGNADWCGYIFSNTEGRAACTKLVTRIKNYEYPELHVGKVVEQRCFSGLKYVLMPIVYGGDVLGRVIYGPFLPEDLEAPTDDVRGYGDGFDVERLWRYRKKIRRAPDETVGRILTNFRQVIDTIIAIAYKALMTQHMHLESITSSYHDLFAANQQLTDSIEKLKELDKVKANFLAMISHELRTPLTSIIGYSEMMLEGMVGDLEEEQTEFVATIREKGESLLELIGSILDLSKIESGTLQLYLGEIEVSEVVNAAFTSVVPQAKKNDIELVQDIGDDLPTVTADREKIGQVIVNLLANAVKFTGKGGCVTLKARPWSGSRRYSGDADDRFGPTDESFVRIDVIDTGVGIPQDKLDSVFAAFYQVDNSATRQFGGTGLGLAIVKSFVDAHGGEVWVESEIGQGTTFSVVLPLTPPSEDSAAGVLS